MKKSSQLFLALLFIAAITLNSCNNDKEEPATPPQTGSGGIDASTNVPGYGILSVPDAG